MLSNICRKTHCGSLIIKLQALCLPGSVKSTSAICGEATSTSDCSPNSRRFRASSFLRDKRRRYRPHHSVAHHGSRNSSATATINALLVRVAENAATPAAFGKRATFRPKQRVVPRPDPTLFRSLTKRIHHSGKFIDVRQQLFPSRVRHIRRPIFSNNCTENSCSSC